MGGKFEDKFWMRESVAVKRLELLVNACVEAAPKKEKEFADADLIGNSGSEDNESSILPDKIPRLKVTMQTPDANRLSEHIKLAPLRPAVNPPEDDDTSSRNTDDMLQQAADTISRALEMRSMPSARGNHTNSFYEPDITNSASTSLLASILNGNEYGSPLSSHPPSQSSPNLNHYKREPESEQEEAKRIKLGQ